MLGKLGLKVTTNGKFFLANLFLGLSKSFIGMAEALENRSFTKLAGYPWFTR